MSVSEDGVGIKRVRPQGLLNLVRGRGPAGADGEVSSPRALGEAPPASPGSARRLLSRCVPLGREHEQAGRQDFVFACWQLPRSLCCSLRGRGPWERSGLAALLAPRERRKKDKGPLAMQGRCPHVLTLCCAAPRCTMPCRRGSVLLGNRADPLVPFQPDVPLEQQAGAANGAAQ